MDNDQSQNSSTRPGVAGRSDAQAQAQPMQQMSSEDEDEGLALGEIIAVLMDYRWLIAAVSLLALVLGLAWVFVAKPVYRADGLLQVEEKSSGMGSLKALQPLVG
jgi:tyrosine-protein kinase Etk/Wzc